MTDTFWRGVVLSSFYFLLTTQSSNARHHHHKPRGQQCRTAMSVLPVHFTFNNTAQPTAPTTTTAPASDPSKPLVIALTGIPWQYEGKPIKSTGAPAPQALTVTLPANQTTVPGATPSGDIKSTLCFDAGALYSCSSCNRILYGKECYKKIGPEELETFSSGEIACTKWYSRTGYAEGGGVTMCGAESGDVYQCSKDEDLTPPAGYCYNLTESMKIPAAMSLVCWPASSPAYPRRFVNHSSIRYRNALIFLTTAKQTESATMVTISLRSTFSGLLLLLFLGPSMSQPLSDLGRRADLINTTLQTATEYSRKVAHSSRPLPFQ
ncbi:hypothetical protein H4Q26_014611 [Puccinia striiformis f. sp. tritici PST-130]|nr:hypothetical protein H4Q26_014611 [Puccinia striiformis f. sp. tritici PST-130]